MTQSEKASRVFRALATLRDEYVIERRTVAAGVLQRALQKETEGGLGAESAARLHDILVKSESSR